MKEKCFGGDCLKRVKMNLSNHLIAPFKDVNKDIQRLFSYFLHSAPNIESIHSKAIERNKHLEIFERMMKERHFQYQKFCWANAIIENELMKGNLNGDEFCLKCKRFVCKKKPTKKEKPQETDLECFLRHIRNAIAHGRVYLCNTKNNYHIIFEDENASKNLSARIVCKKADLEHWKKVLNDSRNFTNN